MKQFLKSVVKKTLTIGKIYPTALTDKTALKSLLRNLYPISQDKQLIRLGPRGDGGYLLPDDLEGIEACFSPGVSFTSGFEKDCANLGMKVFLADRSVDTPAETHALFHFTKKYIGITTNDAFMTIDDWIASSHIGSQSDFILQVDIEGYEYEMFLGMSDSLMSKFRIIIAEFHWLDKLWSRPFFQLASHVFEKILQSHTCVHIHPNNNCNPLNMMGISIPPEIEFTFLRNDRIVNPSYAKVFPHPLDFDNTDKPHLPLPECWYNK
ncbi:MAG: FkbM family methyltransferase [Deltaproteobacteria bacterium]|uniref:FkbM family methyltransferase n=1 Tax=Desulfobacula sp. TaxID=2593537 RepID=UPI0019BE4494|nr:FkbM family methyltransferase [Candidatus Desulfobacula maris]MBL6995763.1 FkbM family methyltransferase [Desulfobacula sp.]